MEKRHIQIEEYRKTMENFRNRIKMKYQYYII